MPAPSPMGAGPDSASSALGSAVSRSGPQRKAKGQREHSDSQVLIWGLVAVGVVIMILLMLAIFIDRPNRRGSSPDSPKQSETPADSAEGAEPGSSEVPDTATTEDVVSDSPPNERPEPALESNSSSLAEPDPISADSRTGDNG